MKCPSCGAENPDLAEFCSLCFCSMGFADDSFTLAAPKGEGFHTEYPSSFKVEFETRPEPGTEPQAGPVDIGEYGRHSGHKMDGYEESQQAPPVDIGEYGKLSGAKPGDAPLVVDGLVDEGRRKRWRRKHRGR